MPWEENDTQIMTRLRDPADFQDGTFRTIAIKKDKPRVWGIVAKLKGDDAMTLQALRFPKADGWTMKKAKKWFSEHEEDFKHSISISEVRAMMMGAMPVHHTDTTDESWDAGKMMKALGDEPTEAQLRAMHAWMDPEGDPKAASSYKLPHHMASDGKVGAANMKACSAAMGALNGARGGVKIPEGDRKAVHRHLAAHMMDGDMDVPELKSFDYVRAKGEIEYRMFPVAELRADDGDSPKIIGHAAVFNRKTELYPRFFEQVAPGAFSKTIEESDIRALFNHDPNFVLGRNTSKTLKLKEDKQGLAIEALPPDTQMVRDLVLAPMKRGDIDQMSFGFRILREQWEDNKETGEVTRTLLEVRLFDVSVVTFAAYPQTDAAVRSLLLDEHDIDFYAIRTMMAKIDHGLGLSDEERSQLETTLATIKRYLGPATPGLTAAHLADTAAPPPIMETLRRLVALERLKCAA